MEYCLNKLHAKNPKEVLKAKGFLPDNHATGSLMANMSRIFYLPFIKIKIYLPHSKLINYIGNPYNSGKSS